MTARIDLNNPVGWTLLSGTYHSGHIPGEQEDLQRMRMTRQIKNEIEELIRQGRSNREIALTIRKRYCQGLEGEQLQFMLSHGAVRVRSKDVWYIRKRLEGFGAP